MWYAVFAPAAIHSTAGHNKNRTIPDLGSATESPALESPSCPPSPPSSAVSGGPPSRGRRSWCLPSHEKQCSRCHRDRRFRFPLWGAAPFGRCCWCRMMEVLVSRRSSRRPCRSRARAPPSLSAAGMRLGSAFRAPLSRQYCPCAWPEPPTFLATSRPARPVQNRSKHLRQGKNITSDR